METITTYRGITETHSFSVTVLWDPRANRYVARIDTSNSPAAPRLARGQEAPTVIHEIEEVTHDEVGGVVDLAEKLISSRCGKILQVIKE
jgi:hypothetical protein